MPTVFAETHNLILREIVESDVDDLFELDSDPRVHRFLGNRPVKHKEQIIDVIRFIRGQYERNGIGRWATIEKSSGAFIGWSGLKREEKETNGHTNYIDLGFRFKPGYWGKGYATESSRAAINYGFDEMKVPVINGAADVDNVGSNKVFEKLQFERVETFLFDGAEHNWYRMSQEHWKQLRI